ncbi:MAG: hypothetical protein AAF915_12050 [Cyanobacteria bacterium P01_D01_bin.50]
MTSPTKYWQMCILPMRKDIKLKHQREISQAKEFFKIQFPHLNGKNILLKDANKQVQTILWKRFHCRDDIYQSAMAGLCLRCYVSHGIFIACKTIPHVYNVGAENLFSYSDLLPLVLNDRGKTLVILGSERKTQYVLNHRDGTIRAIAKDGEFFSVNILRKFNPDSGNSESLDSWITRLTRQNENIKSFLWGFGLGTPSDWKLLCKSTPRFLSTLLSIEDQEIFGAFQTVYQRDRLQIKKKGRCLEPTVNQLQEMLRVLESINYNGSPQQLIARLKYIAEILRQDWIYRKNGYTKTVSIEIYDHLTNNYFENPKLPIHTDRNPEDIELEKLQIICQKLFHKVLYQTIEEAIRQHIENLKKSKSYKNFATLYLEGLRLYYQENKSLSEIAKLWKIEWSKARRIFKLEKFLSIVQYRTEEIFSVRLLQSLNKYQSTRIFHEPDKLKNIAAEVREFLWNKTFKEAKAELIASKKQIKNSLFTQVICIYLNDSNYKI